jgi:hypothetical protein
VAADRAPGWDSRTRPASASAVKLEVGRRAGAGRGGAAAVADQPPPAGVPGAERVRDLEHHVHRAAVPPRRQRRPEVREPYPQLLVLGEPGLPRVVQQVLQREVDRDHRPADRAHQVEVQQVRPQRRVPGRFGGRQLADDRLAVRLPTGEPALHLVDRVPGDRLPVQRAPQPARALPPVLQVGQPHVPPAARPVQEPGARPADRLVHPHRVVPRVRGVHQPDPAGPDLGARPQPRLPRRDHQVQRLRRRPVPEPLVDRGLRGPQHRQRLAAGDVQLVQLAAYQRGEHAAPPVGGRDPDQAHRRGRHRRAARHRDGPGERQRGRDHVGAVEGREAAVRLEDGAEQVALVGVRLVVEGPAGRAVERRPLLGAHRPDRELTQSAGGCHPANLRRPRRTRARPRRRRPGSRPAACPAAAR